MTGQKVKPKTLAEFKAELLSELRSEFEPRLTKLESGYGELKDSLAKIDAKIRVDFGKEIQRIKIKPE